MKLNEVYVKSIANELINFDDAIPTNIQIIILDNDSDNKWRKARKLFLIENKKVNDKTLDNRVKVSSIKTLNGRATALEKQVRDFTKKYPQYSKVIK